MQKSRRHFRQDTSKSAGSGATPCVLELGGALLVEVLLEACVCAGSGDIPWAWLAANEKVSKRIRVKDAMGRGRTKKRTVDEYSPLNRAPDGENRIGHFRQVR